MSEVHCSEVHCGVYACSPVHGHLSFELKPVNVCIGIST